MADKRIIGGGIGAVAAAILAAVVAVEGGFVDNPADPGGPTNHGVTQAVARRFGYTGDMRDLTVEQAQAILYADYIQTPGFSPMLQESPAVAQELVDSSVNAGPAQATKWLQRGVNSLNGYGPVDVDGKFGPATAGAYHRLVVRLGSAQACRLTIKLMDAQQAVFYMGLDKPQFIVGWIEHRVRNVPLTNC